jgi:hypothetical protein
MRALNKLFFDPRCRRVGGGDGDDDGKEKSRGKGGGSGGGEFNNKSVDAEEDDVGDNCYYYLCVEGDIFNQRPLPFIIRSWEFMESGCEGLNKDKHLLVHQLGSGKVGLRHTCILLLPVESLVKNNFC